MGKLWEKGVRAVRQKQVDELSFPCHGNSQRLVSNHFRLGESRSQWLFRVGVSLR